MDENEKKQKEEKKQEENFNQFINLLVELIEKYGDEVLEEI